MPGSIDVTVPDIGDFKDVPVIEVLVKPGDIVKRNDSLIVLESEKASMEVPSPADGMVQNIVVKLGDKVAKGSAILTLAGTPANASTAPAKANTAPAKASTAPANASTAPANASTVAANAPAAAVNGSTPVIPSAASVSERSRGAAETSRIVELTVPDIGDFKDVPVIEVLVKPGDVIERDASIATLESEKASMEIPATAGGTVESVRVKVGDKVAQGTVLATLKTALAIETGGGPSTSALRASAQDDSSAGTVAAAQDDSSGGTVAAAQDDSSAGTVAAGRDDKAVVGGDESAAASFATPTQGDGAVHASPSVRRFARELGVDLRGVRGRGPNGRVTREDVQGFVKSALQGGATASGAAFAGLPPWPKVDFAQYGEVERTPLSRIKKLSGPNLHRNWLHIPHITNYDEADVTDLETFRQEINAEQAKSGGAKLTMLAFLVKACVAALKRYPDFNASLDGDALVHKKYYNIGFAADTPNGLIVPVLKDADAKGLLQIARESAELAAKARDGKLSLADMQGGTFTISSIGGIGGTAFTQIVNAPEVAILGATKTATKPVWNGKEFVPRLILPVSVSYDHRVIDGASAARYLAYLVAVLRDFRRSLL